MFQKDQEKKENVRADGALDNRHMEWKPWKMFRCVSDDHLIAKCPKPPIKKLETAEASKF